MNACRMIIGGMCFSQSVELRPRMEIEFDENAKEGCIVVDFQFHRLVATFGSADNTARKQTSSFFSFIFSFVFAKRSFNTTNNLFLYIDFKENR